MRRVLLGAAIFLLFTGTAFGALASKSCSVRTNSDCLYGQAVRD